MTALLRSKKAIGLPAMLGIVAFVIAFVATLLTYSVFHANLIDQDFQDTEAYINAVEKVEATVSIIVREQSLDQTFLDDLAAYMDVTISPYSANVWSVSASYSETAAVTSYLTGSADLVSTYDTLFAFMGNESGFTLDPLMNPTSFLGTYLQEFIANTFPSVIPQSNFTDFQSIMDYVFSLASSPGTYTIVSPTILSSQSNPTVSGHWYVNGNLTLPNNRNLTVPDGYFLFIDGKLTMRTNSTIFGNVVINGDLQINSKKNTSEAIKGTVYLSGSVRTGTTIDLGTSLRPTFIFSERDITFGTDLNGYGYFLCDNFTVGTRRANINITGGVYALISSNLNAADLNPNPVLDTGKFYDYSVPLYVEAAGGSGNDFRYTYPR